MRTKQEILDYLNFRKEYYQRNILFYKEKLAYLDFDSNDYIMYYELKKIEIAHLYAINDLLEFINQKEDQILWKKKKLKFVLTLIKI